MIWHLIIPKNVIYNVYSEIRKILSKYLFIEYQSNMLGYPNEYKYFSMDECNIISINNKDIWILGIIDN